MSSPQNLDRSTIVKVLPGVHRPGRRRRRGDRVGRRHFRARCLTCHQGHSSHAPGRRRCRAIEARARTVEGFAPTAAMLGRGHPYGSLRSSTNLACQWRPLTSASDRRGPALQIQRFKERVAVRRRL